MSQEATVDIHISKFKINNTGDISTKEIKQSIATEFPSMLPWKKKPVYDEEIFKEDIIRIANLYTEYGFYDVKVNYNVEQKNNSKVEIEIDIDRGEQIVLTELNLAIKPPLPDEDLADLIDNLSLKQDGFFSAKEYQRAKNIIKNHFSNKGYPFAEISSEALVNRAQKWAKVSIEVNRGAQYFFGDEVIEGNKKIENKIIDRELKYKPEQIYSLQNLDKTRLAIFALGYFSSVVIDTNFKEEEKIVDTTIRVEEKKLGSVKLGVGFGTEDLFRGQIIWNQKNLFGGARDLEVAGKFSFLTQRLSASLTQPYLFDKEMDFISTLSTSKDDFPSYTSENLNFSNEITKKIFNDINFNTSFSVQYSRLSEISGSTSDFVEDDEYFLTFFNIGLDRSTV
ncbi:MAG: BamA/TamA family outer membrane protein, partial [Nitrosopumilaceae archaeon]|nr:BamA/TamA family outer membrane protein [Nitrosopumilaceae archaeon]